MIRISLPLDRALPNVLIQTLTSTKLQTTANHSSLALQELTSISNPSPVKVVERTAQHVTATPTALSATLHSTSRSELASPNALTLLFGTNNLRAALNPSFAPQVSS
jgi:hypothetical protein